MIVLGIDPGLANTGFGVVARSGGRLAALDGGVVTTPAAAAPSARLARLARELGALLDEHEPEAVALEALFFGANVRSAFAVGQARGVVLAAAGARGIDCFDYTPQQVKGAVCGTGRAPKAQVARMVQAVLRLPAPPAPDHAADALAVAVCHANHAPLAAATAVRAHRALAPSGRTAPRLGVAALAPAAAAPAVPEALARAASAPAAPEAHAPAAAAPAAPEALAPAAVPEAAA